jgi:hypothetical protein
MACRLTEGGLYWSADQTSLNSKRGIFPQHDPNGTGSYTIWCFFQSSTPLGWSPYTSDNNKILRVVDPGNQTGGTSGGSLPFSSFFTSSNRNFSLTIASLVTQPYQLQAADTPQHTHSFTSNNISASPSTTPSGAYNSGNLSRTGGYQRTTTSQSGSTGSGAQHFHPVTVGNTFPVTTDFSVQYIDVKFCTFDG